MLRNHFTGNFCHLSTLNDTVVKKKIGKKWRDSWDWERDRWRNEHRNKQIMQFFRCGKEAGMGRRRVPTFVRLLKNVLSFRIFYGVQKIEWITTSRHFLSSRFIWTRFMVVGRQKETTEKTFLIIFLFPQLTWESLASHPFSCDVEVIIGLRLIFITSRRDEEMCP